MDISNARDYLAVILVALAVGLAFARRDQVLLMPARQGVLSRLFGPGRTRRKTSRNFWPEADDDSDAAADKMIAEMRPAAFPEARGRHQRRNALPAPVQVTLPCLEPGPDRPYPGGQRPPWDLPADPYLPPLARATAPQALLTGPHAWLPGSSHEPPRSVREVRSAIGSDLGPYLEEMPGYDGRDLPAGAIVPASLLRGGH
ncbi:MAG: hypothetical protein JWM19_939 [Actinomycetia bacterium]|nr:hypothetical protein [Actinomycetes bacterium]